jgi:NhaP-type Na+/H+ or K+/H+ antiporter
MEWNRIFRNLKNIVWASVIAAVCGIGVLVSAFMGSLTWIVAFGFVGLISATLASREK